VISSSSHFSRPAGRTRPGLLGVGCVAVILLLVLTPTGCYLSRGAWEESKILARRRPIDELVRDPRLEPAVRQKLRIVLAARAYAKDSIRLRVKESFTTFSQLDKDTLVLLLSAAYRDRLEPYTWWFPIVGRVPYKGYFDFDAAKRAARQFYMDGYDVSLRPSDAFSTLGWFNDPLLSTSLKRDSLDLVNTVIHELTHNTFYAPGSAAFNESFASFVGARGAAAFFRSRGQPAAALRVDAQWADEKLLGAFWTVLSHTLDSAYAAHPDNRAARIAVRDTVYLRARASLINEIAPRFRTVSPRYSERVPLDNASLLAHRVYAKDLDLFDAVYAREGYDLKRTIGRIIALAKSTPKDPYGALKAWLSGSPTRTGKGATPTVAIHPLAAGVAAGLDSRCRDFTYSAQLSGSATSPASRNSITEVGTSRMLPRTCFSRRPQAAG
jgi:predicted aminopeptidase